MSEDVPDLLPFVVTTADRLRAALPEPPPPRIVGVIPGRGGAVIIAQAGAGKTTLLANLARDLLEGTPFLDRQPVRQIGGRVALLSYEMDAAQLIDWCTSAGVDLSRLVVVDLRDVQNPLRDPWERQVLGDALNLLEVEVVMIDTFGRAFTGDDQNSAAEVTAWFAMLNHFTRGLVRASEWVVAAHAGWTDGRGRGSSALHDSPDAVLVYSRDRDTGQRSLQVDKFRGINPMQRVTVEMDPDTLRLSAGASMGSYGDAVLAFVAANPDCTQNAIRAGITGKDTAIMAAVRELTEQGRIIRTPGPNRSMHHSLPVVPEPLGTTGTTGGVSGGAPLYIGGTTTHRRGPGW